MKFEIPSLLLTVIFTILTISNAQTGDDPEANMSVPEAIAYHGYPVEEYEVTTEDGYILIVHYIPYGKNNGSCCSPRKQVIIAHGLELNSGIWVVNIPQNNLAYALADNCYGVWLLNFRGNNLAKKHVTLSPDDKKFWEFSFHEMGQFDIPAVMEKASNVTGVDSFDYIGYSMGTTSMFVHLSLNPNSNKINSFQALAPAFRLTYSTNPILSPIIPIGDLLFKLAQTVGYCDVASNSTVTELSERFCDWMGTQILCSDFFFFVFGYDQQQFNDSRLPVILNFFPAGAAAYTFAHYYQTSTSGIFRQFDHGYIGNLMKYGQPTPPVYDTPNIKNTKIFVYSGLSDNLADPKDVEYILNNTGSIQDHYVVPWKLWNHGDFVWGTGAKALLYNEVLKNLNASNDSCTE